MKFATALSLLSITAATSQACELDAEFTSCDLSSITLATGCTVLNLATQFGITEAEVPGFISEKCAAARQNIRDDMLPWSSVTVRGKQFDDTFFDGGSIFNTQDHQTVTGYAVSDDPETQRLKDIKDVVLHSGGIQWPDSYIKNFDSSTSCQAQTAMCCWTATRNGSSPEIPAGNSNVCHHDMYDSPKSARVEGGEAIFPGSGEGETVCQGFYWDGLQDEYKGNLLFQVAMQHGLMDNGYVRNIPGAPMCACIEQMPTISNAGCTKMDVVETFKINYSTLEETYDIILAQDQSITFSDCGSLKTSYEGVMESITGVSISDKILGTTKDEPTCDQQSTDRLAAYGYAPKDPTHNWQPIAGKGLLAYPIVSSDELRQLWSQSNTKILRRRCLECNLTHKDIYYRRINDVDGELPENFDLLNTVLDSWVQGEHNVFNVDFELYNSYEAALTRNQDQKWTYCNFHSGVGFPRDCGPHGKIDHQWNKFYSGGSKMVAFYVDLSTTTTA